ncbi:MAG TPA: phosphoglucosamine mutase [Planctomycetota bacterium]|nr:phosphoglucosamine mutase [Planctomycetota bacterium]
MGEIFGTDGVRDRAGQGWLAPEQVRRLALCTGLILRGSPKLFRTPVPKEFRHLAKGRRESGPGKGRVLIGRDTRASGPELEASLVEGFSMAGVGTILAGVLTTPGVAALTRRWACALGVVISASHNPAEDNGIKLISPQGFKIPDAAEAAIEARLDGPAPKLAIKKPGDSKRAEKKTGDYLELLEAVAPRLKGLKIVADCAHGASSAYAGELLRRLGAKAIVLNAAPDGLNINAGCGALHPEGLAKAVRREKADAGVAFDGDADRAIFVDETGEIRDGDHVLAICGAHLAESGKLPGKVVVSTVMANLGLERVLAKRGIALRRTKVGDRYVAEEMLKTGAVLGGEQSGHVLFYDAAPAGDGMLTMLRVLGILAERGEPFSKAASLLVKYPQVLLNVKVARKPPLEEVDGVQGAIRSAEAALGEEGRVLVRYSGTENLCRVMVEGAEKKDVDRTARAVADAVKEALA